MKRCVTNGVAAAPWCVSCCWRWIAGGNKPLFPRSRSNQPPTSLNPAILQHPPPENLSQKPHEPHSRLVGIIEKSPNQFLFYRGPVLRVGYTSTRRAPGHGLLPPRATSS